MKVDVDAIARDYGFGLTMVVSAAHATDGSPVDGLEAANFEVAVIQGPSGWSMDNPLKISPGISEPRTGVYAFSLEDGNKKVAAGSYTLAVVIKGFKGWAPLYGQTLATASMK